jgi:hypothetical protein
MYTLNSVQTIEEIFNLTIVNKKTWRTCDFPVWERVKHIVPVYNAQFYSFYLNQIVK